MEPTFMMSLKIYWSLVWRMILAGIFVIGGFLGFMFLMLMAAFGLEGVMAGHPFVEMEMKVFLITVFVVGTFVLTLYIYRWALNCLPEINYCEGRVVLMKHAGPVVNFGLFDTLCVFWSYGWRNFILMIPVYAVLFIVYFSYYGVNYGAPVQLPLIYNIIVNIASFFVAVFALEWMISRKKEGRWIRLEARHEKKV